MDNTAEIAKKLRELADLLEKQQVSPWSSPFPPQDDGMCAACRPSGICMCVRPGRDQWFCAGSSTYGRAA